jgi:hypothetical protein
MKILKKLSVILAKTVGVLLLTLVLFVVFFLTAFFIVPEMEVKEPRLRFLVERFAPEDLKINWDSASFRIVKTGALSKDLLIDLGKFCVNYKDEAVDACFDRVFWGVGFSLSNFNPRIVKFPPLVVTGGRINGDLNKLDSEEEKKEESGGFDIVNFVRETLLPNWQWNGSIVELLSINMKTGARRIQGAFLLESQGSWDQSILSKRADELKVAVAKRKVYEPFLRASIINLNIPGAVRTSAQVHLILPGDGSRKMWKLLAKGDAELPDGKRALISSHNEIYDWDEVDFHVDAILKNISYVRQAQLRGEYRGDNVDGFVSAKVGAVYSQIKTLDFLDCGVHLELNHQTANVRCGPQTVTIGFQERPEFSNRALFRLYPTFDLKISNFSYARGIEADWDLKFLLDHMNMMKLDVDAFGSFASINQTDTEEAELHYSADTEVRLDVAEFVKVVQLLRKTPFAIPAPVNNMSGQLSFFGSGQISEQGGKIPFRFQTRLASSEQKLFTTLGGEFALQKNYRGKIAPALRLDLSLEDVLLSIPRIDVTSAPPQMTLDSRFKKGLSEDRPPTKTGGTPMEMTAHIATIAPERLRLNSNLAGAPIPITLRYMIRPKKATETKEDIRPARAAAADVGEEPPVTESQGRIYIGRTPLNLKDTNVKLLKKLQRDAVLDYADIVVMPDGTQKIEGRVLVKNPDAEIRIIFLGTMDQPVVRLESEPPAEQDQIMAALLFGRPLDEIDEDQMQAGAQAKTALNDTALTLVQMFLLANTPVDSLNYDAESGRVVASMGIANGTSLEIGGGSGSAGTEVGLRRRIAKNVYLNTYVENSSQTDERLVSAFVEWVRRF